MKTKQLTTGVIGFVYVPDDAYGFTNDLVPHQIDYNQDTKWNDGIITFSSCVFVEKGSWQIIEPTEEVLSDVMPTEYEIAPYESMGCDHPDYIESSKLESFQTLKQSLGIDEAKRYVVLFKPNS